MAFQSLNSNDDERYIKRRDEALKINYDTSISLQIMGYIYGVARNKNEEGDPCVKYTWEGFSWIVDVPKNLNLEEKMVRLRVVKNGKTLPQYETAPAHHLQEVGQSLKIYAINYCDEKLKISEEQAIIDEREKKMENVFSKLNKFGHPIKNLIKYKEDDRTIIKFSTYLTKWEIDSPPNLGCGYVILSANGKHKKIHVHFERFNNEIKEAIFGRYFD